MLRREFLKKAAMLLGGTISASVIAGCMHESIDTPTVFPTKLSSLQKLQLTLLSERIIPRTNTPGAIDAKVPEFIDMLVSKWHTPQERQSFIEGLNDMSTFCDEKFGNSLIDASDAQLDATLSEFESRASSQKNMDNDAIFPMLRELVVVGFFTSKVGVTQSQVQNHMAGQFIGDYPANNVERAFAPFY